MQSEPHCHECGHKDGHTPTCKRLLEMQRRAELDRRNELARKCRDAKQKRWTPAEIDARMKYLERFVRLWWGSATLEEFCVRMGIDKRAASNDAASLRRHHGLNLKSMPPSREDPIKTPLVDMEPIKALAKQLAREAGVVVEDEPQKPADDGIDPQVKAWTEEAQRQRRKHSTIY